MDQIYKLRQKVTDVANQVKHLETKLGQSKASLEIANADNSKLLSQLGFAEKERDTLRTELETLKQSRKDEVDAANNLGLRRPKTATPSRSRPPRTFFKSDWKAACEQLSQGFGIELFTSPSRAAFLPAHMVPYANDVFNALQEEAEEKGRPNETGQEESGVREIPSTIDLEAAAEGAGDDFADHSPLVQSK